MRNLGTVGLGVLMLLILLLNSCRTQVPVFIEKTVTDSIYLVDTLVEVKLKPYYVERTTSDTISHLKSNYSSSTAKIANGELFHNLEDKDTIIKVKTKVEYRDKIIKEPVPYEVEKIVKVEKKLNNWQKIKLTIGGYVIVLLAGLIAYNLIKRK